MSDPLADIVGLLKPQPSMAKQVSGAGRWRVSRSSIGGPFYCAVLQGACVLTIEGRAPLRISAGDFLLVPEIHDFTITSLDPPGPSALRQPLVIGPGIVHLGEAGGVQDFASLVGHCLFAGRDRGLLVALLPEVIHARDEPRLTRLVAMIDDETRSQRPAREMVLGHLLELLLIEALRSAPEAARRPGVMRGLADPQLGLALRLVHARPAAAHSVASLARASAMSRSAFHERFRRELGTAPMDYVTAWRMALAKELLTRRDLSLADIAARIGYGSASAFSAAFSRRVGASPGAFAAALSRG